MAKTGAVWGEMIGGGAVERGVDDAWVVGGGVAEGRRSQGIGEGTMKRWRSGACGLLAVGVAFVLGGFSSGVGAQTGDGAVLLARKANAP